MIRLDDVHLSLAGKPVLRGIDLTFSREESLVIMGESGIGKSTILKVVLGLWKPDRGTVSYDGEDIHRLSESELARRRKKLAIVFQGGALFDSMTLGENVGYRLFEEGRLPQEEIEEIVLRKLEAVDLAEAVDMYPAELSGGMRKRAAIARALAADPDCILFDEPTAGLDPVAACKINNVILNCRKEGKGMLIVTHDLGCAFSVGERLVFIDEGRIVFEGDRRSMESSTNKSVRRFLDTACLDPSIRRSS